MNRKQKPKSPRRSINPQSRQYVARMGMRIRAARAQRSLTQKTLARDSGVSERFLAQLEAGHGNASVLVLRSIADALGCAVDELLSDAPQRPVDLAAIDHMLSRLTLDQLAEARQLLARTFPRSAADACRYIALLGLRGCGKTTLGKMLARHLDVAFVELDRVIEREYGTDAEKILSLHGQQGYRRHERQALETVLSSHQRAVIEIGGRLATDPQTLELLLARTRTVWIRALEEEHMQRVIDQGELRPMANSPEAVADLRAILKTREPFYKQAALHLNTARQPVAKSFRDLLQLLQS